MAEKLCMQVKNFISCHLRNSKKCFHLNYCWSHNRKSMILLTVDRNNFNVNDLCSLCHDAVVKEFKVLKNSGLNGTQTMASVILVQRFTS